MIETDLTLDDGRTLHAYDSGARDGDRLVVLWQHGTPTIGTPPRPLEDISARLGLRWISYDRPGYATSTPQPGRRIADAAGWGAAVADWAGVGRFAVLGHSGGGAHALATAAGLGQRVAGAVSVSGLAPADAAGLDWWAGFGPVGRASLSAAVQGRAAKQAFETSPAAAAMPDFTPADLATLDGEWGWFEEVVGPALAGGPGGLIDDDLAHVAPWGFDPATITAPVLLLHGADDAVVPVGHSRWLATHCPRAELRVQAGEGHLSVLRHADRALTWLVEPAAG